MPSLSRCDPAAIRQLALGGQEMFVELVAIFAEDSAKLMDALGKAIEGGDAPLMMRSAHTLKGSLSLLGASSAAETARQLEAQGRQGEMAGAGSRYEALQAEIEQIRLELAALVDGGLR